MVAAQLSEKDEICFKYVLGGVEADGKQSLRYYILRPVRTDGDILLREIDGVYVKTANNSNGWGEKLSLDSILPPGRYNLGIVKKQ